MALKAAQVEVIIVDLVQTLLHLSLNSDELAVLLFDEIFQLVMATLLKHIHYPPQLCEMLLQFILNHFPIPTLHPLQVLQCLHHLVLSVLDHDSSTLNILLDMLDGLGDNFDLLGLVAFLKDALGTQQFTSCHYVGVDQYFVLLTLLVVRYHWGYL